MKRFTETTKWKDPWFRKLTPPHKLLWLYLCDECDMAGFIDPDMDLASFMVGAAMDLQGALEALGDRIKQMPDGKWQLVKFIGFQYGELNPSNPCHKGVIRLLKERGIKGPLKGLARGLVAPQGTDKDKDKDKGTGKEKDAITPTLKEVQTVADMRGIGRKSADAFWHHYEGNNKWLDQFGKLKKWEVLLDAWAQRDRQYPTVNGPEQQTFTASILPGETKEERDRRVLREVTR